MRPIRPNAGLRILFFVAVGVLSLQCCNCLLEYQPQLRCAGCLTRQITGAVPFPVVNASGVRMHMKSISVHGLEQLIDCMADKLEKNREAVSSNDIASYLKRGNTHPAQERPDLFSHTDPDTALTYQWSRGNNRSVSLCEVVSKLKQRLGKDRKIWIDVLFIDQQSLNIGLDLGNVQAIYAKCQFHVAVESGNLLNRAWCLFELLVRFKAKKPTIYISDGTVTYEAGYDYYGRMQSTTPDDKEAIQRQIYLFFPGDEENVKTAMNAMIPKQVGHQVQDQRHPAPLPRTIPEQAQTPIPRLANRVEMVLVQVGQSAVGLPAFQVVQEVRVGAAVGVPRSDGSVTVGRVAGQSPDGMVRAIVNSAGDFKDVASEHLYWLCARLE